MKTFFFVAISFFALANLTAQEVIMNGVKYESPPEEFIAGKSTPASVPVSCANSIYFMIRHNLVFF